MSNIGEIRSDTEIINMIAEVLWEADGEFIESIANQVLTERVEYLGDSLFSINENPK